MLLTTPRAQLNLADDEVVRLFDACDSRLEVLHGFVWLTLEGERNDVVLGAGQSFLIESSDAVTISALRGASALRVHANVGATHAGSGAARLAHRPSRLQQALARFSLSAVAFA